MEARSAGMPGAPSHDFLSPFRGDTSRVRCHLARPPPAGGWPTLSPAFGEGWGKVTALTAPHRSGVAGNRGSPGLQAGVQRLPKKILLSPFRGDTARKRLQEFSLVRKPTRNCRAPPSLASGSCPPRLDQFTCCFSITIPDSVVSVWNTPSPSRVSPRNRRAFCPRCASGVLRRALLPSLAKSAIAKRTDRSLEFVGGHN